MSRDTNTGQLELKTCGEMAKDAVRESMTRKLRHKTQELPLEKACVFIVGRKQTSAPKKDLKK